MDRFYVNEAQEDYLEASLVACQQLHKTLPPGDILCFLPGREDIEHVHKAMEAKAAKFEPEVMKVRLAPLSGRCHRHCITDADGSA